MSKNNQLLIIEDNPADYARYLHLLLCENHRFSDIVHIDNLKSAYQYLAEHTPSCCILDFHFPGSSARQLIQDLYRRYGRPGFPIVISTGQGNERLAVELMQMGVQDYLVKDGLTGSQLIHALQNATRLFAMQQRLHYMSHYDSLTGLVNRSLLINRLEQAVNEAKRYQRSLGLIYLDIDHFKQINDTYGYEAGDLILKTIAERLRDHVRSTDTVARLEADEFVILLPETSAYQAHTVAQKLLQKLPTPIQLEDIVLHIYPSLGLANFPESAQDSESLLQQAQAALDKAKEKGFSHYVRFSNGYQLQWQRQQELNRAFPEALRNDKIKLAYQPLFKVDNHQCCSVEALVRWQHKDECIRPEEIVNLIYQGSMAVPFHEWLFNESLAQLKQWQCQNPRLNLALNIPANLCHNNHIVDALFAAIERHAIAPTHLIMEVTETHLMRHPELTKIVLLKLAERGIKIAIDDFGTGYSSMEYLANLPCHQIKIDQRFFLDLDHNDKNKKIIEAITALGHRLGLEVIAEGIETQALAEIVRHIGCDRVQGYWFGMPEFGQGSWEHFIQKSVQRSQAGLSQAV